MSPVKRVVFKVFWRNGVKVQVFVCVRERFNKLIVRSFRSLCVSILKLVYEL